MFQLTASSRPPRMRSRRPALLLPRWPSLSRQFFIGQLSTDFFADLRGERVPLKSNARDDVARRLVNGELLTEGTTRRNH